MLIYQSTTFSTLNNFLTPQKPTTVKKIVIKPFKRVLLLITFGMLHPDGTEALKPQLDEKRKKFIYFVYRLTDGKYLIFYKESKITEILPLYKTYSVASGLLFQGIVKNLLYEGKSEEITFLWVIKEQRVGKKYIPFIKEKMEKNGWLIL